MSVNQGDRGPARAGDPALDRPNLVTDMCRNVDLPLAAFNMNHLVRLCLLFLRKLREELSRCHLFSFFAAACRIGRPEQAVGSHQMLYSPLSLLIYIPLPFSMSILSILWYLIVCHLGLLLLSNIFPSLVFPIAVWVIPSFPIHPGLSNAVSRQPPTIHHLHPDLPIDLQS